LSGVQNQDWTLTFTNLIRFSKAGSWSTLRIQPVVLDYDVPTSLPKRLS
jgi:hypothetical protein